MDNPINGSSSSNNVGISNIRRFPDHHNYQESFSPLVTMAKISKVKRMSIGDDLPHMPEETSLISHNSNSVKAQFPPQVTTVDQQDFGQDNSTLTRSNFVKDSAMIDREKQRMREQVPLKIRRRWRITTGFVMLLVLGICSYVLAQYTRAYLAFSPSTWFLSDAQDGTHSSPDPLLRSLALIGMAISAVAVAGVLASGFYLRMTRRKSCGRLIIWSLAILSTILSIALSLANLALIAIWHKQYYNNPNDAFAKTRDVGQRCNGKWDLDLLWGAAKSSNISANTRETCPHDALHTTELFFIAGGVRLAVFTILCTIWLICLSRYNAALQRFDLHWDDTVVGEESPEMHGLLAEEKNLPNMPEMQSIPGHYEVNKDHAMIAAPRLNRFAWQRGEPSMNGGVFHELIEHDQDQVQMYADAEKHDRDQSAGAWTTNMMDRLRTAISNNNNNDLNDDRQHLFGWQHGRDGTRLGVRGWFASEAAEEIHQRTPSQENRMMANRHEIARQIQEHEEQSDRKKKEQRERIEFLASFSNAEAVKEEVEKKETVGDKLPHMPGLFDVIEDARIDNDDDEDEIQFWQPTPIKKSTPVFVRQLGKLVRQLSAIESVGSGEASVKRQQGNSGSEGGGHGKDLSKIY